jgi:hypothetical protein
VIRPFARVAQDRGAVLVVDEDAGRLARHVLGQREVQSVVDDLLAGGDCRRLFGGERRGEAEHFFSNEARWSKGRT